MMTWTETYYSRVTSGDGKRTWLRPERRLHAYRQPGLYRETMLDEAGQPSQVQITDVGAGRTLVLDLAAKKATLKMPVNLPDPRGPFAWVGDALRDRLTFKRWPVKSISLQGRQEVDRTPANVVRAMIDEGADQGPVRRDFCFDVASKRLIGLWAPNDKDFDLETALRPDQPAEAKPSSWTPIARWEHEIDLDPKLDAAAFSLTPPAGYAFEAIARPTLSEAELVEYLGAAARFNDGVFPDSPGWDFDRAKFNAASEKAEADRTPAERALIRIHDQLLRREMYRSPGLVFAEDHAEPGSFRYVGAAARIGQGDRLIAWWTPRGEKMPRAIFGDLAVRTVAPADLPLDLAK